MIGTLTARATGPVDIVTGDRDLFQLVDDERGVRVLYPLKGVGTLQLTDEAWLREKYGVDGRGYADLALLRGDPSDGLPGVPGIGEKTAAKLLAAVRRPGRDHGRGRGPDGQADAVAAQAARRGRGRMSRSRRRWCGSPRTCRCRTSTPALPRAPRDPAALEELADALGAGRVAAAAAHHPRRAEQRITRRVGNVSVNTAVCTGVVRG